MKTLTKLSLASLLLSTSLLASNSERMEVTFNTNKDGSTSPRIFVPIYWSENIYSGLGYETVGSMSVTGDGTIVKTLVASTQDHIWLNILNYQSMQEKGFNYSVGLAAEYRKFHNEEFGTFSVAEQVNKIENSTKIDVMVSSINVEVMYKELFDIFSFRLGAYVNPYSRLSIKQNTSLKPLITNTGASNSTQTQPFSYRMSADVYIKTGQFFDISLNASYENLPLEYDVSEISATTNLFVPSTFKTVDKTTSLSAKVILSHVDVGGMNPMLGYSAISYDNSLNSAINGDVAVDTPNENRFLFGFEKKF